QVSPLSFVKPWKPRYRSRLAWDAQMNTHNWCWTLLATITSMAIPFEWTVPYEWVHASRKITLWMDGPGGISCHKHSLLMHFAPLYDVAMALWHRYTQQILLQHHWLHYSIALGLIPPNMMKLFLAVLTKSGPRLLT